MSYPLDDMKEMRDRLKLGLTRAVSRKHIPANRREIEKREQLIWEFDEQIARLEYRAGSQ